MSASVSTKTNIKIDEMSEDTLSMGDLMGSKKLNFSGNVS